MGRGYCTCKNQMNSPPCLSPYDCRLWIVLRSGPICCFGNALVFWGAKRVAYHILLSSVIGSIPRVPLHGIMCGQHNTTRKFSVHSTTISPPPYLHHIRLLPKWQRAV